MNRWWKWIVKESEFRIVPTMAHSSLEEQVALFHEKFEEDGWKLLWFGHSTMTLIRKCQRPKFFWEKK